MIIIVILNVPVVREPNSHLPSELSPNILDTKSLIPGTGLSLHRSIGHDQPGNTANNIWTNNSALCDKLYYSNLTFVYFYFEFVLVNNCVFLDE